MRKGLLLIGIITCCLSCDQAPKSVAQLDWMIGTWTREFNGHLQMEKWVLQNDTLVGSNSFINGSDTSLMVSQKIFVSQHVFVLETIEAGFEMNQLYLATETKGKFIQFENKSLSWPHRITYANKAPSMLEVLAQGSPGSMAKEFKISYSK